MGVEYFVVDVNKKEYFELGKMYNQDEILDLLALCKKQHKSYDFVKKKIVERDLIDNFDEELEYDNFLVNIFLKALYAWMDTNQCKLMGDCTFYEKDYDQFKKVGSVYIEDNDLDSLSCPMYSFEQALSEMKNGKEITRKSNQENIYRLDGQNLYLCKEGTSSKIESMNLDDILANDWVVK